MGHHLALWYFTPGTLVVMQRGVVTALRDRQELAVAKRLYCRITPFSMPHPCSDQPGDEFKDIGVTAHEIGEAYGVPGRSGQTNGSTDMEADG